MGRAVRSGVWGFLIGGAVGFATGLIFAPEEGRRMRRRLAYQLDHLGEQAADLIDRALSEVEESEAKRQGDELVADAKEKASRIRSDIDALLGEMRQEGPENQ